MNKPKVGIKYFWVSFGARGAARFHIETRREVTEYSSNLTLYESEQAYLDEKEENETKGNHKGRNV